MVETFGAHYVSLHVRVSNQAAIHLYKTTLGFQSEKTESKYYADGEDAYSMRLDLSTIREQVQDQLDDEKQNNSSSSSDGVDEGEAVGDVGSDPAASHKKNGNGNSKGGEGEGGKEGKRKVKVGRGLGVGELVERDESKHSS